MLILLITQGARVTVHNHKDLRKLWRQHGPDPLIGRVTVETTLTPSQRRRLPAHLRKIVREVPAE